MLYNIYAVATASQFIGQVEAESKFDAEEKAEKMFQEKCDISANVYNKFDIGDADMEVEECSN